MKKVVVTGGAGFIGSHLVDALVEKGLDVHVIDIVPEDIQPYKNSRATYHLADIRNIDDIRPVISGAMYVFHLAALPSVQYSIEHPKESHDTNVTGTLNVLIAAKEAAVTRVIFSASSAAYGDTEHVPSHEELPAQPKSPYALHKCIGELQCRTWSLVYDLSTVSLRYFNVYGPRLNPNGPYASVIGKFLQQRKNNQALTITGDGLQTRDFVHVRDVVVANISAAENPNVGAGEVINIGSGTQYSIKKIADIITGPVENLPARLEPRSSLADISKARAVLDWSPQVSFEEGLRELLN